jgi:hypothetical protein
MVRYILVIVFVAMCLAQGANAKPFPAFTGYWIQETMKVGNEEERHFLTGYMAGVMETLWVKSSCDYDPDFNRVFANVREILQSTPDSDLIRFKAPLVVGVALDRAHPECI